MAYWKAIVFLSAITRYAGVRSLALGLLFLLALLVLGLGVNEPTGITGKDEYYLSLRTPLCMLEQQNGWVPCLDSEPRLRKPPLVYWLTYGSFNLFGPSLTSARLVAVTLAAVWVLGIALIALEWGGQLTQALLAGLIALSFLSLNVGGRILELDVPVAAFSTLAFYALLRGYRREQPAAFYCAAIALAAGLLTKGPVALIVCGSGSLALLAFDPAARIFLVRRKILIASAALLAMVLSFPWFIYVAIAYPETSAKVLAAELASRHLFQLSLLPLYAILLLALPWSFILLTRLRISNNMSPAQRQQHGWLLVWLTLTILPFFLMHSFERYLFGSLVPLALLLALTPITTDVIWRWSARLGLLLTLPAVLGIAGLVLWFNGFTFALIPGLIAAIGFTNIWWRAHSITYMALSAALLWMCSVGLIYPRLEINQVPADILAAAKTEEVVFYHGPQPGLLPILLGRSLIHVDERWQLPAALHCQCARFLLFAEAPQAQAAAAGLISASLQVEEVARFGVLSSRVSWARLLRPDLSQDELWAALWRGDLNALKPQVVMYQVTAACPGT